MEEPKPTAKKRPRKVSARSLENAALHYLRRYATSVANLRRVLLRRVDRSIRFHGGDREEPARWVDALLERFVTSGLLNDEAYTRGKVSSLRSRGNSGRAIRAKLSHKGLGKAQVEAELGKAADDGQGELEAAVAYARRRKLGALRTKPPKDERAQNRKDLASLVRAGFAYPVAKRTLELVAAKVTTSR